MANLLQRILHDYLCRISPAGHCASGDVDASLALAASSRYRPGAGIVFRGGGLLPGSTPEGIRAGGISSSESYPDPQSPPVLTGPAAGVGGAFPVPALTEEVDQDEFRTVGVTPGTIGFFTVLPAQLTKDVDVLEMTFQPAGATAIQVFLDAARVSGNWNLSTNQQWSAPGLTILRQQAVTISVSAAVVVTFEIRWKWKVDGNS